MTRISDDLRDCTIYMYPTVTDAEKGEHTGGTGFLVSMPSEKLKGFHFTYAVTNRHVIEEGNLTIRLNKSGGGISVQSTLLDEWHRAPQDDIAIRHVFLLNNTVNARTVPLEMFATSEVISDYNIGIGQDVVMVGRFVNYDGEQENTPTARFGNISMMLHPVKGPDNFTQHSFVVEMRSLSGFSGSPVFVYAATTSQVAQKWIGKLHFANNDPRYTLGGTSLWLLGVDWGHGRDHNWSERVLNHKKRPLTRNDVFNDQGDKGKEWLNWSVVSNSGLTNVVPASRLYDLLFDEDVIKWRTDFENQSLINTRISYIWKNRLILLHPPLLGGKIRVHRHR